MSSDLPAPETPKTKNAPAGHALARRTLSTCSLLALLFCVVYFGGIYGAVALMTIVSTLSLFEFYKLSEHFGGTPRKAFGLILGTALVPYFFSAATNAPEETSAGVPVLLGVSCAVFLFGIWLMAAQKIPAPIKSLSTFFGLVYIPFSIGFYALLAGFYGLNGVLACVWIVLAAKFTDIGGLLIGCKFGKHKLAPNISPKKTWEGVVGGLVFSMLFSAGLIWAFAHFGVWQTPAEGAKAFPFAEISPLKAALLAVPIAGTSIVSDLIESAFKRQAGDKDSGATIPGIGGALDLLDSLIFVAPLGYALITFAVR